MSNRVMMMETTNLERSYGDQTVTTFPIQEIILRLGRTHIV